MIRKTIFLITVLLLSQTNAYSNNLLKAARSNKTKEVAKLIEGSTGVNVVGALGDTPIYWACFHGNRKMVSLLIPHCTREIVSLSFIGLNEDAPVNETSIYQACKHNDPELARLIFSKSTQEANNLVSKDGKTPLLVAYENGNTELIGLVLSYSLSETIDASLVVRYENGKGEILGDAKMVKVENHDDGRREYRTETLLGRACRVWNSRSDQLAIIELLVENGATLHQWYIEKIGNEDMKNYLLNAYIFQNCEDKVSYINR